MSIIEHYKSSGIHPYDKYEAAEAALREACENRDKLVVSILKRFVVSIAFLALTIAYLGERNGAIPWYVSYFLVAAGTTAGCVLALLINEIEPLAAHNKKVKKLRQRERYWREERSKYTYASSNLPTKKD